MNSMAIPEEEQEGLLERFRQMIDSAAMRAARAWGLDFEDVQAQAHLVFMEAVVTYDREKASFSTHLWNQLRRLNDYCAREVKIRGRMLPLLDNVAEFDWSFTRFCAVLDFVEAQKVLSQDARDLLHYILAGDWMIPDEHKLHLTQVQAVYKARGWRPYRTYKAWKEIEAWYHYSVS